MEMPFYYIQDYIKIQPLWLTAHVVTFGKQKAVKGCDLSDDWKLLLLIDCGDF